MNPLYKECEMLHKECAMCKKKIENSSNYIPIRYDKGYLFFHRFCYFNYRTEGLK